MLITPQQRDRLIDNFHRRDNADYDPAPVVKLFTPWTLCAWLLTELDPASPDRAYGLRDHGMGVIAKGIIPLTELAAVRGPWGIRIKQDPAFESERPLSEWIAEAHRLRRIPWEEITKNESR